MSDDAMIKEIDARGDKLREARSEIAGTIIGQDTVVGLSLAAMLSGGHALLMGLPGLGKNRPFDIAKRTAAVGRSFQHLRAKDIAGHQIRCELDAVAV